MKVYLYGGNITWKKSPILSLIQFGTDSPYFHVDCEYIKDSVIGSLFKSGVTVRTLEQAKKDLDKDCYIDVYECLEEIDKNVYFDFLKAKIGEPYDRLGIVYLAWLKIMKRHDAANKWQKDKDYFCSELACNALRWSGAKLLDIPQDSVASPADIARSKSFKFIEKIKP